MSKIQQFDFSTPLSQALLWNENKAEMLEKLVLAKQAWYDIYQEGFWLDWYRDVFNLQTANDFGCAVWAIILGLPIFLNIPSSSGPAFGFGSENKNFNHAPFGNRTGSTSRLTLEQKRIILRLRYYQLTSRGDITTTNQALNDIFGSVDPVYVLDGLDMSITCVFRFYPDHALLRAIKDYDLIPRNNGVRINYIIEDGFIFGFGPNNRNFNNGTFEPIV